MLGYSPLAGGLLTGKYREGETGRLSSLKNSDHANAHINDVIDALSTVASEVESEPGQVAISWASAHGVIPILGAKNRAQLENNMAAASIRLNDDQLLRLDAASAVPAGYPHELLAADNTRAVITGNRWSQIDFPKGTVA